MKLPGKQVIAKAVFAIAVVATTATVGVVGYAQAAQSSQQSGYGGSIEQLIAAINQFRQSVLAATNQYREDVNACLGTSPINPVSEQHGRAARSASVAAENTPAKDAFNRHLDDTVGHLKSRVGDSRSAQEGTGAFEKTYDDAAGKVFASIDGANNQLAADLGVSSQEVATSRQSGGLFDCLDKARNKYRQALDHAKAVLIAAIREILG